MNRFKLNRLTAWCVTTALLALAACGGGDGGGSTRSAPAYSLGGTVSGLDEGYVDIRNGLDVRRVSATADGLGLDQTFNFDTPLPAGVGYDVQIANDPSQFGLQCVLASAQGAMPARAVSSVAVRCARIRSVRLLAGALNLTGSRDGLALQAVFNQPKKLALDSSGNLYLAEATSFRRITPGGAVTTIRSAGLPVDGLAVDSSGNLYSAAHGALVQTTALGSSHQFAGEFFLFGDNDGVGGAASFRNPTAMVMGAGDQLYVLDSGFGDGKIRRVTPSRVVSTVSPFIPGDLRGLAMDATGIAYSCRTAAPLMEVLRITATAFTTIGTFTPLTSNACANLALDGGGSIRITDGTAIHSMTTAGQFSTLTGFGQISGMTFGGNRLLFVTPDDNTVRMINSTGAIALLAGLPHATVSVSGHTDGSGSTARFNQPSGLAVDASGNVYVADSGNHVIRRITPSGTVSTFAGGAGIAGHADGASGTARFNTPNGVAVDAGGNVWVTELVNRTLRRITPTGTVSTVAGHPTNPAGSADGTGTAARFAAPRALTIDAGGNVHLIDDVVVRRITPAAVVTTLMSADGSGIATDRDGNFFWTVGSGLMKDSVSGGWSPQAVFFNSGSGNFNTADAMATGPDNEIYVASRGRNLIYRLDRELFGTTSTTHMGQIEAGQVDEPNAAIGPLPGAVGTVRGLAVTQRRVYFSTDNAVLFFDR